MQMKDAIRVNRKCAGPRDPEVCAAVTNMWYNPPVSTRNCGQSADVYADDKDSPGPALLDETVRVRHEQIDLLEFRKAVAWAQDSTLPQPAAQLPPRCKLARLDPSIFLQALPPLHAATVLQEAPPPNTTPAGRPTSFDSESSMAGGWAAPARLGNYLLLASKAVAAAPPPRGAPAGTAAAYAFKPPQLTPAQAMRASFVLPTSSTDPTPFLHTSLHAPARVIPPDAFSYGPSAVKDTSLRDAAIIAALRNSAAEAAEAAVVATDLPIAPLSTLRTCASQTPQSSSCPVLPEAAHALAESSETTGPASAIVAVHAQPNHADWCRTASTLREVNNSSASVHAVHRRTANEHSNTSRMPVHAVCSRQDSEAASTSACAHVEHLPVAGTAAHGRDERNVERDHGVLHAAAAPLQMAVCMKGSSRDEARCMCATRSRVDPLSSGLCGLPVPGSCACGSDAAVTRTLTMDVPSDLRGSAHGDGLGRDSEQPVMPLLDMDTPVMLSSATGTVSTEAGQPCNSCVDRGFETGKLPASGWTVQHVVPDKTAPERAASPAMQQYSAVESFTSVCGSEGRSVAALRHLRDPLGGAAADDGRRTISIDLSSCSNATCVAHPVAVADVLFAGAQLRPIHVPRGPPHLKPTETALRPSVCSPASIHSTLTSEAAPSAAPAAPVRLGSKPAALPLFRPVHSYLFQPAAVAADVLPKGLPHPHMSARTAATPAATAAARPDAAPGSLVSEVRCQELGFQKP